MSSLGWFIILMLFVLCCQSHDIRFTKLREAAFSIINCPDNDICNIHLTGNNALQESTLNCPSTGECNINCDADKSCLKTIINCPTAGYCIIKCNGRKSCEFAIINGPKSGDLLKIECNDFRACSKSKIESEDNIEGILDISTNYFGDKQRILSNAKINCPKNGDCIINVSGSEILTSAYINAKLSELLQLKTTGNKALSHSKIYCPYGKHKSKDYIDYEPGCLIDIDTNIAYILEQVNIYAVEAFRDFELICVGDGPYCSTNAIDLHCKPNYDAICRLHFVDGKWKCSGYSICNSYIAHDKDEL